MRKSETDHLETITGLIEVVAASSPIVSGAMKLVSIAAKCWSARTQARFGRVMQHLQQLLPVPGVFEEVLAEQADEEWFQTMLAITFETLRAEICPEAEVCVARLMAYYWDSPIDGAFRAYSMLLRDIADNECRLLRKVCEQLPSSGADYTLAMEEGERVVKLAIRHDEQSQRPSVCIFDSEGCGVSLLQLLVGSRVAVHQIMLSEGPMITISDTEAPRMIKIFAPVCGNASRS